MANFKITPAQLAKFKKICRKHGFDLDESTARQQALNLLYLVALTRRPLPDTIKKDEPTDSLSLPTSGAHKP